MKKNLIVCMALIVSAVMFFGCMSAPVAVVAPVEVIAPDYRVVDSKAMTTGMSSAPAWYEAANDSTSALKKLYPDSISVSASAEGSDLAALKLQLETFAAPRELASRLSTYASTVAGEVRESDDSEELSSAMNSFTAVASKAEFVGLTKEADYWILREYQDGSRTYVYTVLFLMDNDLWAPQLNDQLKSLMTDEEFELLTPYVDRAIEQIGDEY